jgi:hypothetical protein
VPTEKLCAYLVCFAVCYPSDRFYASADCVAGWGQSKMMLCFRAGDDIARPHGRVHVTEEWELASMVIAPGKMKDAPHARRSKYRCCCARVGMSSLEGAGEWLRAEIASGLQKSLVVDILLSVSPRARVVRAVTWELVSKPLRCGSEVAFHNRFGRQSTSLTSPCPSSSSKAKPLFTFTTTRTSLPLPLHSTFTTSHLPHHRPFHLRPHSPLPATGLPLAPSAAAFALFVTATKSCNPGT